MGEHYRSSLPAHALSRSDKRLSGHSHERPRRLYQVWKGRNKFCLGGRFIFGPDVRSIFLTLSLILVPVILFWAFVAKGLIATFSDGWGTAIVVLSIVLTVNIVILLLLTSGRDPGIIPRNSYPMEFDDFDTFSLATDWGGSQSSATGFPLRRNITINGIIVRVKYCQTCKLYRPPRCSHCSICNNCVERFDHHCPWIGQCIGKRNYRHFFMFVSSTTLLCLYVLTSCLINISRTMDGAHCSMWRAIQKSPVSGILIVYTFVVCWFVGGLTVFHLYLIATNQIKMTVLLLVKLSELNTSNEAMHLGSQRKQPLCLITRTTYENFRYQYNQKLNPYNLGFDGNCKEVFCYKIPRSRNDFRENVKVESCTGSSVSSYLAAAAATPEIMKLSLDAEMENRQRVDEFEGIRRVRSLERCGTQPRRYDDWGREDNWERNPEKYIFSPDFGSESSTKEGQKITVEQ